MFARIFSPSVTSKQEVSRPIPYFPKHLESMKGDVERITSRLLKLSKSDWDQFETSWDFGILPILAETMLGQTISEGYARVLADAERCYGEVRELEQANNCLFIREYGLDGEIDPRCRKIRSHCIDQTASKTCSALSPFALAA